METESWSGGLGAGHLDPKLPMPLYHQIYQLLRDRIRGGSLESGEVLPGEQELAKIFNVSRITVKRSLNELASDGLVTRHRGRGTVVSKSRIVPVVTGSFDTLIQSLRSMGLETAVELLDVEDIEADESIAGDLDIEPGDLVQRSVRRRKLEGEPFSHLVSFVPSRIAKTYSIEELAAIPLLSLLERAGAAGHSAEQWITAVGAEPTVAAALGVAPSAALLRIKRVLRSEKGVPVQLVFSHYRPDRFQYYLHTFRPEANAGSAETWHQLNA